MVQRVERTPTQVPPGYPWDLCGDTTLADGRVVHVRPIVPDDRDALLDAIRHADEQTLRRRFLGGVAPTSERQLDHLVVVDYRQRLALIAIADAAGVGIARYEPTTSPGVAEAAVAVDPQWRRVGLGIDLLVRLGRAALERGYTEFSAAVLADNQPVLALLRAAGREFSITTSQGVSDVRIGLTSTRDALPPS